MALKYHPDVYKGENAQEKFIQITEAYQVLVEGKVISAKNAFQHEHDESIKKAREKARADMRRKYSEFKAKQEKEQNEQFTRALYIFAAIIITLILSNIGVNYWNTSQAFTNCDTTLSRVVSVEHHAFKVIYNNGERNFVGEQRASRAFTTLYYENGMPLEVGQEFMLAFNKEKPKYFKVLGTQITKRTLLSYYNLTAPKIKIWLKQEGIYQEGMESCVFKKIYQKMGVEGLSQMFYFNEAMIENIENNSVTFTSFKNKSEFLILIEDCTLLYKP